MPKQKCCYDEWWLKLQNSWRKILPSLFIWLFILFFCKTIVSRLRFDHITLMKKRVVMQHVCYLISLTTSKLQNASLRIHWEIPKVHNTWGKKSYPGVYEDYDINQIHSFICLLKVWGSYLGKKKQTFGTLALWRRTTLETSALIFFSSD